MSYSPPFPWFGGKSRVAHIVWQALGNVDHYVEPFFGGGAVLFLRPHKPNVETVNDKDRYVANFWRAVQHDPEGVAHYANNPVNEADLTARHIWLVNTGAERIARIEGDPDFYDVKVAGWWVWGISCWIGGGWCSGRGPWTSVDGKLTKVEHGVGDDGATRHPAHLGNIGKGVKKQHVHLGNSGMGIHKKLVHLGNIGKGVSKRRVQLGGGTGIHKTSIHSDGLSLVGECSRGTATGEREIADFLQRFAERLRYVRVTCGDWSRVLTKGALNFGKTVGIFLDPPYDPEIRYPGIYTHDGEGIAFKVRQWCLENQHVQRYRIVLAGYEGEHNELEAHGWRKIAWKAARSMGRSSGATANSVNRFKERLWLSPNCFFQASLIDWQSE